MNELTDADLDRIERWADRHDAHVLVRTGDVLALVTEVRRQRPEVVRLREGIRAQHKPSPYDGRCITCADEDVDRPGVPSEFEPWPCLTGALLDSGGEEDPGYSEMVLSGLIEHAGRRLGEGFKKALQDAIDEEVSNAVWETERGEEL